MRASKWHTEHSLRRGGRVRLNAHAWNACRLERVSGVRIPPSPPPSPYLSRYLAPTTEKPAPAASFAYAWSRRKSLSGRDRQFAAKISVGKFGATVWARSRKQFVSHE